MNDLSLHSQSVLLAEKTLSFNLMPCVELDDSWLEAMPQGLGPRIMEENSHVAPQVGQYLLDTFEIADRYWSDFSASRNRLALLDCYTLQKVCMHIGLVLQGSKIRAEVNGAAIKRLRDAVGAEAVNFVFKTAPLIGETPEFYFHTDINDIRLNLIALGVAYTIHQNAAGDSAYTTRLLFKLPKKLSKDLHRHLQTADGHKADDAMPRITRRVIKEVAPQWLPLFN
ncbi:MAG: SctK family type III secretion system sorting platform protein [Pseudomonadota bacterium]